MTAIGWEAARLLWRAEELKANSGYDNQGLTDALRRMSPHPSRRAAKFEESVMRLWALSAVIGAAIVISGAASAPQRSISGSYTLDRGRSDDVFQAIESAAAGRSDATLSLVRKLRKAGAPADEVRISFSAGRFSIKNDAKPVIVVWTSGEPIGWKLEDGQVFEVSAKANGEAVSLTFRAPDSERTTVYRSVGQQLVAETVITSPLLSTPVHYKVFYNRTN